MKTQQAQTERLANYIIANSSAIKDLGLMTGKTGIIIFLYHLSRAMGNKNYADFAGLLLDDLFEDSHERMTISLDKGLCGIGWGLEYLFKNNFVEGAPYETLEDTDEKIMKWDIKRMNDESLESGLEGLFHYILFHLPVNNKMQTPFDQMYFSDLDIVATKIVKENKNQELLLLIHQYINWRHGRNLCYDPAYLLRRLLSFDVEDDSDITRLSSGIDKGCAGIGLQILRIVN